MELVGDESLYHDQSQDRETFDLDQNHEVLSLNKDVTGRARFLDHGYSIFFKPLNFAFMIPDKSRICRFFEFFPPFFSTRYTGTECEKNKLKFSFNGPRKKKSEKKSPNISNFFRQRSGYISDLPWYIPKKI